MTSTLRDVVAGPATTRPIVPLAWASLVANILIVVTGGAVRLTGSGLGCPTWPRCSQESYVPHGSLGIHGAIEFGNRLLTFVLVAVAVATLYAAWRTGRRQLRQLAVILALGIPAQALIGGVTVLTDLNPWIVALHLMVSMAMIAAAVVLVRTARRPAGTPYAGRSPLATLGGLLFGVGWVVLYVGTVVTGSGPHAGDVNSPRNGLDPRALSQFHADLVFLLVGLTVALVIALRAIGAGVEARRAAATLLAVELAQGLIGFVQYATDLPIVLVAVHVFGAGLVAAALTWSLATLLRPEIPPATTTRSRPAERAVSR